MTDKTIKRAQQGYNLIQGSFLCTLISLVLGSIFLAVSAPGGVVDGEKVGGGAILLMTSIYNFGAFISGKVIFALVAPEEHLDLPNAELKKIYGRK